jgi:hypothetical protein
VRGEGLEDERFYSLDYVGRHTDRREERELSHKQAAQAVEGGPFACAELFSGTTLALRWRALAGVGSA